MTDKQIIIDGVEVNALYSEQIACMNRYEVANLFIKTVERLVSKEQECETLASQLDFEVQKKECLEQECEELKENLPNAITRLMGELDQLKAENKRLDNELYMTVEEGRAWYDLMERYEQALTEIKEIAEKAAEESGVFKEYFKRNNYSWKQHQLRALTCKYNIILQKCEVIDD